MRYLFCVGMFRAGSTWQYNVASQLAEAHLGAVRLGFVEGKVFAAAHALGRHEYPLMTLKAHDRHTAYLPELGAGLVTPLYTHRDLRDVAYSYMHKAKLGFDQVVAEGFFARVLENDAFWRAQDRLLIQRYDTIVAEPARAVRAIADHLGLKLRRGEAERLAAEHSWEANLGRTREVRRKAAAVGIDLEHRDHVFEHDPHSLLHWNHLREGQAGASWRRRATPKERAAFAEHCGPWLIANGYEADDAWVTADPDPEPEPSEPAPRPSASRWAAACASRRLASLLPRWVGRRRGVEAGRLPEAGPRA